MNRSSILILGHNLTSIINNEYLIYSLISNRIPSYFYLKHGSFQKRHTNDAHKLLVRNNSQTCDVEQCTALENIKTSSGNTMQL